MDARLVSFSASSQVITVSGNVASGCNGMVFINLGADTVTILGYPLLQSQQFSVPCNVGEVDETNYLVRFAGVSTDQRLLVISKQYKGVSL